MTESLLLELALQAIDDGEALLVLDDAIEESGFRRHRFYFGNLDAMPIRARAVAAVLLFGDWDGGSGTEDRWPWPVVRKALRSIVPPWLSDGGARAEVLYRLNEALRDQGRWDAPVRLVNAPPGIVRALVSGFVPTAILEAVQRSVSDQLSPVISLQVLHDDDLNLG